MRKMPRKRVVGGGKLFIQPLERRLLLSGSIPHLPYNGSPQGVPGTLEVENYDTGGEGVSFHNPSPSQPNSYRHDSIDIEAASDAGGGYAVGTTTPGEWLNYTVNVAGTTTYTLNLRVASGSSGGVVHLNVDGANATGPIQIANTGGWQNWTTVSIPNVSIPAGQHVLTLSIDSANAAGASVGNFNWVQLADNPANSPRTQWWRDAKFGMFIHWGLYSQLAGHWNGQTTSGLGEWIMNDLNIPLSQYAQVANQFDPTLFNARQWVQTAQSAGMKYIVMTSKHHDGFSMFNTSVNTYNVVDATPWRQDPIALMSQATHAAGLHFGVYYSILNWADPNASAAGIDKYMVTMETQLKELITNDHPDILWFDGDWPSWWSVERGRELDEFVRNLNPSIIINDRLEQRAPGVEDFTTPEQTIPTNIPAGRLWETCMTINDTWGYKDTDTNFKSASTLLNDVRQIEAAGGNFLLNVGPTGQGVIPAAEVQILQQIGQGLGVNTGSPGGGTTSGGGTSGSGNGGTSTGGGSTSGGGSTGSGGGGTTTGGGGSSSGGTSTGGTSPGGTTSGGTTTGGSTTPVGSQPSGGVPITTVSFSAKHKAVYLDSHGTHITVTLRGPGAGQLVFEAGSADLHGLNLTGTTAHSVVSIRGATRVGSVNVSGSLGGLLAPTDDLISDVTVSGNLQRLQAADATGGHTISAAALGSIVLHGNLSDDINAGSIGHVTVSGALSNSAIRATGSIVSVLAASASGSEIFAGASAQLNAMPSSSADLTDPAASIKSFVVRGHGAFSDTIIAAGTVGSASLGVVQPANGLVPFGVAGQKVRSVRASIGGHLNTLRNPAASTTVSGDLIVRVL